MPVIIKGIEDYLYETQRDVFYLKLVTPEEDLEFGPDQRDRWGGDYWSPETQANMKIATDWFDQHGVPWAPTAPEGLIEGWVGHLYVGFLGWDDPNLQAWCDEFEIDNQHPKYPEKFAMYARSYKDWVENGRLVEHEEYLKNLNDPDWGP